MDDNIWSTGRWLKLETKKALEDAGGWYEEWKGPGWYLVLRWTGPCPRGCCSQINEYFIKAGDAAVMIADEIEALTMELQQAKAYS